ncbi:hypothetical protein D3C87_2081560 [compost metagenome]
MFTLTVAGIGGQGIALMQPKLFYQVEREVGYVAGCADNPWCAGISEACQYAG